MSKEPGCPLPDWASLCAAPSATSELLLLSVAVLQRECLDSLFCSSAARATDFAVSSQGDFTEYEIEHRLWAIRMSVGLPDVPPVSFREIATATSPLRARLPWLPLVDAEAALVASLASDTSQQGPPWGGGKTGEALQAVARLAQVDPPWSSILTSASQRLPHVLLKLLKLVGPHSLQRQLFERTPATAHEGEQQRLAPAGELVLAVLRLCLQQQAASSLCKRNGGEGKVQAGGSPGASNGELRHQLLHTPVQRDSSNSDAFPADTVEAKKFLQRLAAEREALETLSSAAASSPVSCLLFLEQLLQRPQLQHLYAFQAPGEAVLRQVFYGYLLGCFAPATAPPTEASPGGLRLELSAVCRELMEAAGVPSLCLLDISDCSPREAEEEILPGKRVSIYKQKTSSETCPQAQTREEAVARTHATEGGILSPQHRDGEANRKGVLLLPPDGCDASVRAFCCFLHPKLRPSTPWLSSNSCSESEAGGDSWNSSAKPWRSADAWGLKTETPSELTPKGLDNTSTMYSPPQAQKHLCRGSEERSVAEELRALDDELRPSMKTNRQKGHLLRLLAKWLRTPAWIHGLEGENSQGTETRRERSCKNKLELSPLLLPYGSSVTAFGDWASDLDLVLLLPFTCCSSEEHDGNSDAASPRRSAAAAAAAAAVAAELQSAGVRGSLSFSSCYSSPASPKRICGDKAGDELEGHERVLKPLFYVRQSRSRAECALMLTRLEDLICGEAQLQNLFTSVEVVVPHRAPPVLRGVYKHPRIPRKRRSRSPTYPVTETGENPLTGFLKVQGPACAPTGLARERNGAEKRGCSSKEIAPKEEPWDAEEISANSTSTVSCSEQGESSEVNDLPPKLSDPGSPIERHSRLGPLGRPTCATQGHQEETWRPCTSIKFEITVGCPLGALNTQLLKAYGQCSPFLPPLARLVRHWADCRGLTGTRDGCLSSYAWSLLVVFFCLSTTPPLLPRLQTTTTLPAAATQDQLSKVLSRQSSEDLQASPICPQPSGEGFSCTLGASQPSVMPLELVEGTHHVWFLSPEAPNPTGSRALDLLRPIYKKASESQLLERLQHYIPGHILVMPQNAKALSTDKNKGSDCLHPGKGDISHIGPRRGQSAHSVPAVAHVADGKRPLVNLADFGYPEGLSQSKFLLPLKQRKNQRNTPLRKEDWANVASLFHAFFAFYGYNFNSFSLLVSLQGSSQRFKEPIYRHSSKVDSVHTHETQTGCPAVATCTEELPQVCSSDERSKNSKLQEETARCTLECQQAIMMGKTAAENHAAAPKDTWGSVGHKHSTSCLFVEGQALGSPTEEVLQALSRQHEVPARRQSTSFGIEIEDPMEAWRYHWYQRFKGSEMFYYEVRRAERLLRDGRAPLSHIFVGD